MLIRHAFELAFLVALLVLAYTMFVLPPEHLDMAIIQAPSDVSLEVVLS